MLGAFSLKDHAAIPCASTPPRIVLVVDDDPLLRMFTTDIVVEAGFTAVEAADADEAIAILESRSDIALVLTDINMPGSMDGAKLARAVRDRWPPIKIVVVSGQMLLPDLDLPQDARFFVKPYPADAMISALQSLVSREIV